MSLRAVSGSGSGASPLQVERFTATGADSFVVPDDVSIIFLSGCGGGGGGAGGYSGVGGGGGGGGPAPNWDYFPITVTPGSTLSVYVGAAGSAGAIGANGSDGGESYISGAGILSPFKDGSNQILMGYGKGGVVGTVGAGGNGAGPAWASSVSSLAYATLNSGTGHFPKWLHLTDGNVPLQHFHPVCQASGGAAASANSQGGFVTVNGNGSGTYGTGDASGGAGGAGGGGVYGRGGNAGSAGGTRTGGAATGNGAGGGGGTGNYAGGAGTDGFIEIAY